MTEQLALDQLARERGAVDLEEEPVAPGALIVDRLRDQLFPGSRLPGEQDGRIRAGDLRDTAEDLFDGFGTPDDRVGLSVGPDLQPQGDVLQLESLELLLRPLSVIDVSQDDRVEVGVGGLRVSDRRFDRKALTVSAQGGDPFRRP